MKPLYDLSEADVRSLLREADQIIEEWGVMQRRVWDRLKVAPVKWEQPHYPGLDSVWVVAILGNNCLCHNPIEGGWGWGRFETWGTISEYQWAADDEIHHAFYILWFSLEHGGGCCMPSQREHIPPNDRPSATLHTIKPQLKSFKAWIPGVGELLGDNSDATVTITAMIGPKDGPGDEVFQFRAVTPSSLARLGHPRWGRGLLLVDTFSKAAVETALEKLLRQCSGNSWPDCAAKINRYMEWEFDDYEEA